MRRKKIAAVSVTLAGIMAAAGVMSGCSLSGGDNGKIRIEMIQYKQEAVGVFEELEKKFNETHDDIELVIDSPNDATTIMKTRFIREDYPDIIGIGGDMNYSNFLDAGLLMDISDYEGLDSIKQAYLDMDKELELVPQEGVYAVPYAANAAGVLYNKDIFDEAGIEYPTADWTWDDLQTAAETITDKTGVQGFAFQMKPDPYDFEMYLWSNGTAYCDEEGNLDGSLNSDASKEVFQMFQDMEKAGYATATEGDGTDEFRAGNAAMYIYGSWSIDTLNEDGVNYGVTTIPAFADAGQDSVSILSSSGLSMAADCENKEAAWEFMKFVAGSDVAAYITPLGMPSFRNSVWTDERVESAMTPDMVQAYADTYAITTNNEFGLPRMTAVTEARDIMGGAVVYSIETKGQGPELKGMMEEAAAEVDELLKAYDEYGENYNW